MSKIPESDVKEAFDAFDKKHVGMIDIKDFARALCKLGINPNDADLAIMEQKVDPQDTKKGAYNVFSQIVGTQNNKGYTSTEGIIEAFQCFDAEGNGIIEIEELKHVLLNMGEKLPQSEVDKLIQEADPDGSGRIYYADVCFFLFFFLPFINCFNFSLQNSCYKGVSIVLIS